MSTKIVQKKFEEDKDLGEVHERLFKKTNYFHQKKSVEEIPA